MSQPPLLSVVSGGEPDGAEVAALTTVLLALQSRAALDKPAARSRWRDSTRQGQPWGRTGWRTSARLQALRRAR